MLKENYKISGMSCAACSASVERACRALRGTQSASVNLIAEKLSISYDETILSSSDIIDAVEDLGFQIRLMKDGESSFKRKVSSSKQSKYSPSYSGKVASFSLIVLALALSILIMFLSMGLTLSINSALAQMILAMCVLFIGRNYIISGYKALRHKAPNMDSLVALSSSCSFLYSFIQTIILFSNSDFKPALYYESSAMVLSFVMLGKYLEAKSKEKTKSAIEGLIALVPEKANRLKDDGTVEEIDAEKLVVGDRVLLRPGDRIPTDAQVYSGSGNVDESMFTGESLPVYKDAGSFVTGGSINVDGVLYIRITKVGSDTTLAGIIRIVEEAQEKKAPIAKLADRIAGIFVPSVLLIALGSFIFWIVSGQSLSFAIKIFTCVLVIACPCALGLATPTAIICGTGLGANKGILIRSGEALENCAKADILIFDKTGTITEDKMEITDVLSLNLKEDEFIRIAASIEKYSEHPMAKAIYENYCYGDKDSNLYPIKEFVYMSGKGLSCILNDGSKILCGNYSLLDDEEIETDEVDAFAEQCARQGKSLVYMAIDEKIAGVIALATCVKEGAAKTVKKLKSMGLEVMVLTGDNMAAANYIGKQVGADRVIAQVLPDGKAEVVKGLQEMGRKVIMVGDGINDAPALIQADVGCAIGNGSDVAIDSADIVLMRDDIEDVARTRHLSRLTITNIKENLFWAFFYNCIGIPVAAGALYPSFGILLSPMIGGLAMAFSSIFVVSNALRLKRKNLD